MRVYICFLIHCTSGENKGFKEITEEVSNWVEWVGIWVTPAWRRTTSGFRDVDLDEDLEVAGDIEGEGDLLGWVPVFSDCLAIHYLKALVLVTKMLMDKNDHDQH